MNIKSRFEPEHLKALIYLYNINLSILHTTDLEQDLAIYADIINLKSLKG